MTKESPAARRVIEQAIMRAKRVNKDTEAMAKREEIKIVVDLVYTAYVEGFGAGMINSGTVSDPSEYNAIQLKGQSKFQSSFTFKELFKWCAEW
jgi:hypothetical protein